MPTSTEAEGAGAGAGAAADTAESRAAGEPGGTRREGGPPTRVRFSLVQGGPTHRVARALGAVDEHGRIGWRLVLWLIGVTWLPLVLLALPSIHRSPIADLAVHVRFLVTLPLFTAAERSLHARSQRCIDRLLEERWTNDVVAVRQIAATAARRSASWRAELVLLLLALLGSQLIVWGTTTSVGVFRGRADELSAAVVWFAVVSLPIYQFFVMRWLWRWLTWSRLLWSLSRLELRPSAMHPDRQGGLGFLSEPSVGFGYFVLGIECVQAAVWSERLRHQHEVMGALNAEIAVSVLLALLLALGPLFVFFPTLWRARYQAIREYDALGVDYTRMFHRRWIERGERDELLGTSDIQSLADLRHAYETMATMRLVPIDLRVVIVIAACALAPIVPLLLLGVPLSELLRRLGGVVMGGLPK